ncbi:hypothetical protein CDL12_08540 [Handroanthus impetiginosus]|uniref:Uncharacterized protein n=1 Tax=Handroanthus impetiginosus TaxID=429701 RepID=A0A2G9HMW8_9LAMI|nr:hypothetical protein CDL12_08540 [Handroanthus impetiginosus]
MVKLMALAIHQLQGSSSTSPSVPSLWNRWSKLKYSVPRFHAVGSKNRVISLKCRLRLSVGTSIVLGSKSRVLKISAFKGSTRHDDSGVEANGSKSLKNAVEISYLQNKSEESSVESPKVENVVSAPYTATNETATGSLATQDIFKNWLILPRTPSQTQAVEEIIEQPYSTETSERPNASQTQERGEILKAALCYILDLDATIKIPLLLFTCVYLAINLVYGLKISKELVPLWVLGPLFAAFYIKMFREISGVYASSFKQVARVVKNLPVHFTLVRTYIVHGKLKEAVGTHIFEPLADIRKGKVLQMWFAERFLDSFEFIWPYYYKTLRSLKRANLI